MPGVLFCPTPPPVRGRFLIVGTRHASSSLTHTTTTSVKTSLLLSQTTDLLPNPEEKPDEACLVPTDSLAKEPQVPLGTMKNLPLSGPYPGPSPNSERGADIARQTKLVFVGTQFIASADVLQSVMECFQRLSACFNPH